MRLLLIALCCLAVSSALPKPKEERLAKLDNADSYGTSHDKNAVTDKRSVGTYVQAVPEVVHDVYGPPGYEPGLPLGNDYLPPVGLIKVSTPVPTYAAADAVFVPEVQQTYVKPEVAQTVSSTTVSVPVQQTKTVTVAPPSTSYGVPVAETVKSSLGTGANAHVKSTVKTVKTEIHEQEQNVPSPVVNVVHQAPAVDDVARFASTVKTVPVTTTVTKNVVGSVPLTGSLSNVYDSYAKDFSVYSYPSYPSYTSYSSYPSYASYSSYPTYSSYSSYPSSLYSTLQHSSGLTSYDALSTGYSRLGLSAPVSYHPVSVYGSKTVGSAYSFPNIVSVPAVTSQQPYTLTHAVSRVQEPLRTLPSVSTLLPLQTLTPVSQVRTVQSVKSVNAPLQHTLHTVQSVPTVEYTKTLTPVQQTVHTVQSVPAVEYTKTLTPVQQTVQSAPVVKTVETVTPVHAVHTEQSVKTASTAHPVKSVEILSPPPLQPTESCHTLTKVVKTQTVPVTGEHVQKGFFDDVGQFLQPFFPFLPQASTGAPISVTTENPDTVFLASTPLPAAVVKESGSVSNPVLLNAQVVSSTVSPFENVQPTHANGGYLY